MTYLPLDTSHRGPALCQPPPGWQGPGFLQTTPREVAAGPRILALHTCKSVILNPLPRPTLGKACLGGSGEIINKNDLLANVSQPTLTVSF